MVAEHVDRDWLAIVPAWRRLLHGAAICLFIMPVMTELIYSQSAAMLLDD